MRDSRRFQVQLCLAYQQVSLDSGWGWRKRNQRNPPRCLILIPRIRRIHRNQPIPDLFPLLALQLRRHQRLRPPRRRPNPAVRLHLEVLPPLRIIRVSAIRRHHDHPRSFIEIQQQHRSLTPRLPPHRPKPKRRRPLKPPTHERKDRLLKSCQCLDQSRSHIGMLAVQGLPLWGSCQEVAVGPARR